MSDAILNHEVYTGLGVGCQTKFARRLRSGLREISAGDTVCSPVPPRMLSPLVALDQKHRCNHDNRRSHKTKRIQRKSPPMKQKKVADRHGDGRQNHDEE